MYATTSGSSTFLETAVERLLQLVHESTLPEVLWALRYQQHARTLTEASNVQADNIIMLPAPSLDLAFDETVLDTVKAAWQKVMGSDAQDFLKFEDRNPIGEEDDDL